MIPRHGCTGCGLDFALDSSNTVVYYFENQPWFSYGTVQCPNCRQTIPRLFWRGYHKVFLEYFILNDFGFVTELWADAETVKSFERIYEIQPETEHELTARMELELQNLHVVLENIPDDLLLSMFESPEQPHELPENWT